MATPSPAPAAKPGGVLSGLSLGEIRKFLASVVGLIAIAVTQGLIEGTAAKWVAVILAVATALGVYTVPNDTPKTGT